MDYARAATFHGESGDPFAQIGKMKSMMRHPALPEDSLAEHLMVYYWLGRLEFGSSDGLLDGFYAAASEELRAHATWFIGRSVSHWDAGAPPEVFDRLRKLIEQRLDAARDNAAPQTFTKELANFGWWFTSEKFEERWSLETLLSVLQLTKKVTDEMDVVKLLVERFPRYPVECVSCFRLMVEGDRDCWLLLGVESDAIQLVRQAIASNNPDAALVARRLAEELIARGHFGFRCVFIYEGNKRINCQTT